MEADALAAINTTSTKEQQPVDSDAAAGAAVTTYGAGGLADVRRRLRHRGG